jgi:hypothetical protein
MADLVGHLTKFNQNRDYNFLVNDFAPRCYLPILSDPTDADTDDDGLTDEEEYYLETNPLNFDTDGDKLSDGVEVELWFDPTNANPDGDSYNDKEELANDTSPFVKNKTAAERSEAFLKGGALGDFDTADSIEALCGQIAGSFVPFAADARDYFANVFVNLDTKAALLNLAGFFLDFVPGAGSAGDATKTFSKIGRFIGKYADDAPKVAEAIVQVSKHFPESEDVVKGIAKVLPAGAIDDVCESIKNGSKLTKKDYDKLVDVCKAAGKNADDIIQISPHALKIINGKINKIAKKYKNLECLECSDEIVKCLKESGAHGQKITVKYGNGYVINELYSTTEAISHNGKHYAVLFNGKVFDNLFPEGIDYNRWKDGFFAISGELKISFIDF